MSACFFFSHLSWAFPTGNVWRVIAFQLMRSIHLVKRFKGYQLVENSFTHISNENSLIWHIIPLLYGYFEITCMTWMNDDFLLDVRVKLFYTNDVYLLNSPSNG
jgi:hypothetical protein